jgi:16S rRNA (cytosine967-C5)-methyltransferase
MSRFHSYLSSSKSILQSYSGIKPFPFHLKKYFAASKKFGSKDRKMIAEICYAWLRTSHLFQKEINDDHIIHAFFLCAVEPHPLLAAAAPAFNEKAGLSVVEKLSFSGMVAGTVFPFSASTGPIDNESFNLSFLQQPLLFLRLRPGKEKAVLSRLEEAGLSFKVMDDGCIALANGTKLEGLVHLNKEAVVQDKNSQKVFDFIKAQSLGEKISVWDCCAASGGKSILLYDILKGKIKLTVSDIRENILHNCKMRLREAGININHAFVADVSKKTDPGESFDILICDAPCTGSGTWSRTPEQLAFFKEESIENFSALQKNIAIHSSCHLKKEGLFFYITCSVFKKENEEVVEALQKETGMALLHSRYLTGYQEQADSMFVAVLKK